MLISFLFLHETGTSNEYPQHMFCGEIRKILCGYPLLSVAMSTGNHVVLTPVIKTCTSRVMAKKHLTAYSKKHLTAYSVQSVHGLWLQPTNITGLDKFHVCVCLHWGFTAQSTQWGHVERGQFTSHFYWAGFGDFSTQFRKIILRYKKIGYNINVIRQTVCMVVNPITVNNFASLFTCTPAG